MRHFATFPVLGLLLPLASLSWAQTNSSSPSSSVSMSLSSTSSVNTSSTSSGTPTSSASLPSLSGYPACVTDCLQAGVAAVNCPTLTLYDCYCGAGNITIFTQAVFDCTVGNCAASDLATQEQLAQRFCNLASSSPTLSFPTFIPSSSSPSNTPSGGSSSLQSTPSPTSTPSSGTTLDSGTALLYSGFLAIVVYPLSIYLL